jgi:DNA-binding response OmpR family regulator
LLNHGSDEPLTLTETLEGAGFFVTFASSRLEPEAHDPGSFDAIVLGREEALESRAKDCRGLRDNGYLGAVLCVCADASEAEAMLEAGADDFVTVPYEALELATRLRVCVRRVVARSRLRSGPMELDHTGRVLRLSGRSIALTNQECGLVACLLQADGRTVTRATLRERVFHRDGDRRTNIVEVCLSRVRRKLAEDATMIETVRHVGYRLRP